MRRYALLGDAPYPGPLTGSGREGEDQTHPARGAPAGLPRLEHDDAVAGRGATLQEMRGEGAREAASDDDDVGRGRQVRRGAEAEEVLGRFAVPLCALPSVS